MNPLHPSHLSPSERRAELCRVLAVGLVRLRERTKREVTEEIGESSLHIRPVRSLCRHANRVEIEA